MFPYIRNGDEFIKDCEEIGYQIKKDGNQYIIDTAASGGKCKCSMVESRDSSNDHFKNDFIKCKENEGCKQLSRLVGWLIQRVNNANWDVKEDCKRVGKIKLAEIVAWCQSLGWYMKRVIGNEKYSGLKDKIVIGLEYYLENSFTNNTSTRVDMIIAGYYKKNNKPAMRIVVVELKGFYKEDEKNNVKGASAQLNEYCNNLEYLNEDCDDIEKIDIKKCLYCHNLEAGDYKTKDEISLFFKGNEEKFAKELDSLFEKIDSKNPKEIFREIKRRYKTLETKDFAKILCEDNSFRDYEKYLRPDQRFVYKELKRHIVLNMLAKQRQRKKIINKVIKWINDLPDKEVDIPDVYPEDFSPLQRELVTVSGLKNVKALVNALEYALGKPSEEELKRDSYLIGFKKDIKDYYIDKKKPIDIIHGGPGSGKTVIAILLMGYCSYLKQQRKLIFSREWIRLKINESIAIINDIDISKEKLLKNTQYLIEYLIEKLGDANIIYNIPKRIDSCQQMDIKKSVVIFDEAHHFKGKIKFNDIIKDSNVLVLCYDQYQILDTDEKGVDYIKKLEGKNRKNTRRSSKKYCLWSQFRCGCDEGFVSWIEQILKINNEPKEIKPYYSGMCSEDNKLYISDLDYKPELFGYESEDEMLERIKEIIKKKKDFTVGIASEKSGKLREKIFRKKEQNIHNNSETSSGKEAQGVEYDVVIVVITEDDNFNEMMENSSKDEIEYEVLKNQYRVMMTRGLKECHILYPDSYEKYFKDYIVRPNN